MRKCIIILLIMVLMIEPASALEFTAPSAPESAQQYMPADQESFADGLWYIVKSAVAALHPELAEASGICVSLLAIVLLISILCSFSESAAGVLRLVVTVVIGLLLLEPTNSLIGLGTKAVTELCEYGKEKGVQPLMETNGPLGSTEAMMCFMERVPSENKGVLWDIHHPYRYFGESPEVSFGRIAPLLRHVHVKDSMLVDGKVSYKLLGKGDVPVKETLLLLKSKEYDGFVSLEWVKKWNPELEEAGIVLPQFANYVRRIVEA